MYFRSMRTSSYVADCTEYLTGCKSGKYSSHEQWEGLLRHANEIFHYGLTHGFVICGASLAGNHFQTMLRAKYGQNAVLVDGDDVRKELEGNPERVFIIASKKYCAKYSVMLKTTAFYLNYNHLWIIDSCFKIVDAEFTGSDYVKERMEAVAKNADAFLEMLHDLSDDESKELLARTLLYRITLDDRYSIGIKRDELQYFNQDIISIKPDTIFVDAGGFNGDTLRDFMELSKGQFLHYYLFEPVPALLEQAKRDIFNPRIEFIPYCLWDKDENVSFNECNSNHMSGHIAPDDGNMSMHAISLDHFLDGKPVTFIKMDIEGAEIQALRGAERTIRACKPTLTISAYHMPDNLVKIYIFCRSVGGYKLYLRTTEYNLDYELVLYAVRGDACEK